MANELENHINTINTAIIEEINDRLKESTETNNMIIGSVLTNIMKSN